jgi:hypothetical protein
MAGANTRVDNAPDAKRRAYYDGKSAGLELALRLMGEFSGISVRVESAEK